MLAAVSVVLMLMEFPLPFIAPPFYELDLSEVPVLIGSFALGPLAGVIIEFLKILLNLILNGTITAGVGEAANFLMGISFILPAAYIYKRNKCKRNAIFGMIIGGFFMVILGCFINAYLLVPAYGSALSIPMDSFVEMGSKIHPSCDSLAKLIVFCVAPFNAVKAILVSVITLLIYKRVSPILRK